ncbi:MAG: 3-phosphoshikimate 1-carboxyvinyltransferase [Lachnospiraceae bacterium]|nr:3-phosphoshikimate 1-carboxyvinyltransferase [Lachnospiraceae bacterium]
MKAIVNISKAEGKVMAPPSKSMAHRHLICAGLSTENSVVKGVALSEDVLATLDCLEALGAKYTYENETVNITGVDILKVKNADVLACRECGSTLRFFIPICLMTGIDIKLTGSDRLMERPMSVYEDICDKYGFVFSRSQGAINVKGQLVPDVYKVKGDVSSQFISGLLFTLPLLSGDSKIELIPPVESRSYIDMTLSALSLYGVKAYWESDTVLVIPGNQKYAGSEQYVEGDYSNAAFLDAFNYIGEEAGKVLVGGLKSDSLQGDRVYLKHFKELRASRDTGVTPTIDISDCPDLGPILFVVAACNGGALFTGTRRLKIKESDRGQAMYEELGKVGVDMVIEDDTIEVKKSVLHAPTEVFDGHNDHRIVMSMAVLGSVISGTIDGIGAVRKSYPNFFEEISSIGIDVTKQEDN